MSDKEIEQRFINIDTVKFRQKLKQVGAELINPNKIFMRVLYLDVMVFY